MQAEVVRRRVVVHGQVQGVFFRDSVCEQAREHGITGWVANRSDGAVEAVLEGQPEAVEQALGYCRTGPPSARVERVETYEEPPEWLRGFSVR